MATKKGLGCFTFPAIVFIAIVGSSVLQSFVPIPSLSAFGFILFISSWLVGKIQKNQKFSQRYLVYSIVLFALIFGIRYVLTIEIPDPTVAKTSEGVYREKILEQGDSITILSQSRKWKDNYGNAYSGHFSVREQDYITSRKNYLRYAQQYQWNGWGPLYKHLATTDTPQLDLIVTQLSEIQRTKKLNQFEFAELVVTFIQDIPYSLVFQEACGHANQYEESIRVILNECPDCCIGHIPFGIQNPVAFMGDLKGDCDTRTVIIYAILDYFGYDVAILNSDYYMHSILGVNIPAKGKYKRHKGKRYYVWETTNKHFTIGSLPKNFSNIRYWDIVLTNS